MERPSDCRMTQSLRGGRSKKMHRNRDWLSRHQREGQAIITLAADRLNRGGGHPFFGREHLVETANSLHAGIGTFRVDDFAVADHVVHDDDAPGSRQLERPLKVVRVAGFVGINEYQVEWAPSLGLD